MFQLNDQILMSFEHRYSDKEWVRDVQDSIRGHKLCERAVFVKCHSDVKFSQLATKVDVDFVKGCASGVGSRNPNEFFEVTGKVNLERAFSGDFCRRNSSSS